MTNHGQILRAIGQDLEKRKIRAFDLENLGSIYVVQINNATWPGEAFSLWQLTKKGIQGIRRKQ